MPRFRLTVGFTQAKRKDLSVYARDEDEASQKAEDGVIDYEATGCERE